MSSKKSDKGTKSDSPKRIRKPYKYDPKYCDKLIEHMGQGLSYESFAGAIRVARSTLYEWEKNHPEYAEAKELAIEANRTFWERIGMAGMMGEFEKFNSAVWIFNMKNRFGWTDKRETKTEHVVTLEKIIDDSFEEIETTARKIGEADELEYRRREDD